MMINFKNTSINQTNSERAHIFFLRYSGPNTLSDVIVEVHSSRLESKYVVLDYNGRVLPLHDIIMNSF